MRRVAHDFRDGWAVLILRARFAADDLAASVVQRMFKIRFDPKLSRRGINHPDFGMAVRAVVGRTIQLNWACSPVAGARSTLAVSLLAFPEG